MKLSTFLKLRCPVCEAATIFHRYFDTPERCPSCGFFFMRENGYFLPHFAFGYPVIVFVALGLWPLLRYGFGIHSERVLLGTMVTGGLLFGTWYIRYAKMMWLVFDLWMNPKVKEDFQRRGRKDV